MTTAAGDDHCNNVEKSGGDHSKELLGFPGKVTDVKPLPASLQFNLNPFKWKAVSITIS